MEAQRFPDDYNGIVAGAPANNRTHIHAGFVWNSQAANLPPGVQLSPETIAFITKSVVAACAGKDGGAPGDNFLTDPRGCANSIQQRFRNVKEIFIAIACLPPNYPR